MTEFEYIKSMTTDELFEFLCDISLDRCVCPNKNVCHEYNSCKDCFVDWLNSEHDLKT